MQTELPVETREMKLERLHQLYIERKKHVKAVVERKKDMDYLKDLIKELEVEMEELNAKLEAEQLKIGEV